MINRDNYQAAKVFLHNLENSRNVQETSKGRYWSYLKTILIWGDETPLNKTPSKQPTLPKFLETFRMDGEHGSLAAATRKKILQTAQRLFTWLKLNLPKDFSQLPNDWIDGLSLVRIPESAPQEHIYVPVDEAIQIASFDFSNDLALRRDQAAAAMLVLSGARAGAFCSFPIKAVDLTTLSIHQWPELGVRTKNGKAATTYLLKIPELLHVVQSWDEFVRAALPPEATWYSPIISQWGEQRLSPLPPGKNRSVGLIKRFVKLYKEIHMPYKSPHKFRHGHAVYGLQNAKSIADFHAVSRNLMHANISITDELYAMLPGNELRERILGLSGKDRPANDTEMFNHLQNLSKEEMSRVLHLIAEKFSQ